VSIRSRLRNLLHGAGEHAAGATRMIPGVDVSAWQGEPGAWRHQAGHISWAAVKISELSVDGTRYVSPDAAADWAWLKAAGKGRIAYFYGHPSTLPSEAVALFSDALRGIGLDDGDGVALDLENTDGLTPAEVAAWARAVMALLRHVLGRRPILYTYISFAQAGNCAGLGGYLLWLADPSSPPGHPRIPAPWTRWAIHQWSIAGSLDRDVAAWPTLAIMTAALGKKESTVAYHCDGKTSLHAIGDHVGAPASEILRLTAVADGKYPADVAAWLNEIFAGRVSATGPVPAKCVLRVPA
jgi:lysozyme